MALPVTISGTQMFNGSNYYGPFKSSGGNYYAILLDSTNDDELEAWKATDPTDSFTEQDSGGKPTLGSSNTATSMWVYEDGDNLHIVTQRDDDDVEYHIFNMATDNWDTVEESVQAITDSGAEQRCSITLRSDGDVIVAYQTEGETLHGQHRSRTAYARKEGSWTTDIALDSAGLDNWTGPVVILASSDRSHFMFGNDEPEVFQRSLSSTNTLQSLPGAFDTSASSVVPAFGHGDNDSNVVIFPYIDDDGRISRARFLSSPSPNVVVDSTYALKDLGSTAAFCLSYAPGEIYHLLYADTTLDLFYLRSLETSETELLDGVTINAVSCNIYTRESGATVLAYVYDDAGTVKYNEHEIIAAPPALKQFYHHYQRNTG